jgi:hypothetical protein
MAELATVTCATCRLLPSGGSAARPVFQPLLLDAHQRRFDVVLRWSLDASAGRARSTICDTTLQKRTVFWRGEVSALAAPKTQVFRDVFRYRLLEGELGLRV